MSDIQPLVVESLVRRFGGRAALDGASFSLRKGECLALLGPNGAGKTTLIRSIAGRLKPDSGRVLIHGQAQQAGGDPALLRRLGVIPQNIAIYDNLTARENLNLFGRLFGVEPAALSERTAEALEWTGLKDRSSEPASRFSGGMQRRLNIACGVLHRPDILLLDEPTVGVDPDGCEQRGEKSATFFVDDITRDLPVRFQQFAAAGIDVADLSIEVPTLQSVFLHFTGHELRES